MFDIIRRPRRLRRNDHVRAMVRENHLRRCDLIMPIFVTAEEGIVRPIPSMPGIEQICVSELGREVDRLLNVGVPKVLLFGDSRQQG